MKSQMWVVILAVVFSSYAFAAPMAVTTVKPQTTPANPGLEVQELIILRDYYKYKKVKSESESKEDYIKKAKEYEDRLAPKKANLINLAYDAIKRPNFDESLYSTDVFFDEHRRDVEPDIQKYKDKINYYQDKCPFKFMGNYMRARDEGMDVKFKQDGSPNGSPVNTSYGQAQDFYNGLWAKRNLPYTMDEYAILRDHWQELLSQRIELDKIRGPSQAELFAYHKYLQGPKPPGGYTLPPWITTIAPKKWVLVEYFCGAGSGGGNWCTKWVWQ